MRKILKTSFSTFKFLSLFLSIVMFFSFAFSLIPCIEKQKHSDILKALANSPLSTYNVKISNVLRSFDEYEVFEDENDETLLKFIGKRTFLPEEILDIEGLDPQGEELTVQYEFECHFDTTEVFSSIYYIQDDYILAEDYLYIPEVKYNADEGIGIIYLENGVRLDTDTIFNSVCSDLIPIHSRSTTIALAAAVASTLQVVCEIIIYVCVVVIIYFILKWIFSWVKGTKISYSYIPKVIEQTTTYQAPALSINGYRVTTVAKTKEELQELPKEDRDGRPLYYLAFASGVAYEDGTQDTTLEPESLYIGSAIDEYEAYEILTNPIYTTATQDGAQFSYVSSIYSHFETSILEILDATGYAERTPRNKPEKSEHGLYHYHPADIYTVDVPILKNGKEVTKKYQAHAFCLIFDQSYWIQYD